MGIALGAQSTSIDQQQQIEEARLRSQQCGRYEAFLEALAVQCARKRLGDGAIDLMQVAEGVWG